MTDEGNRPSVGIEVAEGAGATIKDATLIGFDHGIVIEDSTVELDGATVLRNLVGMVVRGESDVTVRNSYFDNIVQDIVYDESADVETINTIAKEIVSLTNDSRLAADADLNREARDVLKAETEEETRSRYENLAKTTIEWIVKGGGVCAGVEYSYRMLTFLAENASVVVENLPEG